MVNWVMQFLGGAAGHVSHVVGGSAGFSGPGAAWLGMLLLGAIAAAAITWRRLRTATSPGRRTFIAILRGALLALIALVLAAPVLHLRVTGPGRGTTVVLLDDSRSMGIPDVKSATGAAAVDRLSEAVCLVKKVSGSLESVGAVEVNAFDADVRPVVGSEGLAALKPTGTSTAIGDAIDSVLTRDRGRAISGILLVSDGNSNAGTPEAAAAQRARERGLPIDVLPMGQAGSPEVAVTEVLSPTVMLAGEPVTVTAVVRTASAAAGEVPVHVMLGDTLAAQTSVRVPRRGLIAVPIRLVPERVGPTTLTASVPGQAGATFGAEPPRSIPVKVVDDRIRVLLAEGSPRWAFRFLHGALAKRPRFDVHVWLADGEGDSAAGLLGAFPDSEDGLRGRFDVLVVGDVSPTSMTATQMRRVQEFVAAGGAVIFIAGREHDPADFAGTPLEALLPFRPMVRGRTAAGDWVVHLTAAGQEDELVAALRPEDVVATLPRLHWVAPVGLLRPGATDLAVADSGAGEAPVVITQRFGMGRVVFVGSDELWRWRKNEGVKVYDQFWGQLVEHAGMSSLLSQGKPVTLTVDRPRCDVGEAIRVFVRFNGEGVKRRGMRSATWVRAGSETAMRRDLTLRPLAGDADTMEGVFVPPGPGRYELTFERERVEVLVNEPRYERGDTAANVAGMAELARISGGEVLTPATLGPYPELVARRQAQMTSTVDLRLAESPALFAAIVAVAGLEWLLRKQWTVK